MNTYVYIHICKREYYICTGKGFEICVTRQIRLSYVRDIEYRGEFVFRYNVIVKRMIRIECV